MNRITVKCIAVIMALLLSLCACSKAESTNVSYDINSDVAEIPEDYKAPAIEAGETVDFYYNTATKTKHSVIYIPYGYSETEQYNIIYGLGGSSSNERYYFGEAGSECELKNIIDNMIYRGDIEPVIFVSDNFEFSESEAITKKEMNKRISEYCDDVRNYLIPAVESEYSTYANGDVSIVSIINSRAHRAFTGFSQGAAITWNMLAKNSECFYYYMPISGSPNDNACKDYSINLVPDIKKQLKKKKYTCDDICIYAYVGTSDYTITKMSNFISDLNDIKQIEEGENLFYHALTDGKHEYQSVKTYVYNYLSEIFI